MSKPWNAGSRIDAFDALASAFRRLLKKRLITAKDCWEWTGARNRHGYGVIRVGGRAGGTVLVHRLAASVYLDYDLQDPAVLHTCDNPPCFNPDHLYVGDQADNMRDAYSRGRRLTPAEYRKCASVA